MSDDDSTIESGLSRLRSIRQDKKLEEFYQQGLQASDRHTEKPECIGRRDHPHDRDSTRGASLRQERIRIARCSLFDDSGKT